MNSERVKLTVFVYLQQVVVSNAIRLPCCAPEKFGILKSILEVTIFLLAFRSAIKRNAADFYSLQIISGMFKYSPNQVLNAR